MNYLCKHKLPGDHPFCGADHPVDAPCGAFEYVRIERPEDLPAADPKRIDVAVLDMNRGWPNLGHDCMVHAVLDAACALLPEVARETGIRVRALSFDVRGHGMIPDPASGRFALYLGTGGPGHIDPAANDGVSEGSQGIREDPSWQQPLYRLFDHILADESSALLAVCHTFGVLCAWSGLAVPVLRGLEKGGKSTGVLENVLAPEAADHPWFRRCCEEMGGRLRVLDNRLFDLIPREAAFPDGVTPIGWETLGVGGPRGDGITMIEFARDAGGVMPRVFGVNHHPEIANRAGQLAILEQKLERGEVSATWFAERREVLTRSYPGEDSERLLQLTSDYTLLRPLRFHLRRQVRLRAESLGAALDLREDDVTEARPPMGATAYPLHVLHADGTSLS